MNLLGTASLCPNGCSGHPRFSFDHLGRTRESCDGCGYFGPLRANTTTWEPSHKNTYTYRPPRPKGPVTRTCVRCLEEKPSTQFYRGRTSCKACKIRDSAIHKRQARERKMEMYRARILAKEAVA